MRGSPRKGRSFVTDVHGPTDARLARAAEGGQFVSSCAWDSHCSAERRRRGCRWCGCRARRRRARSRGPRAAGAAPTAVWPGARTAEQRAGKQTPAARGLGFPCGPGRGVFPPVRGLPPQRQLRAKATEVPAALETCLLGKQRQAERLYATKRTRRGRQTGQPHQRPLGNRPLFSKLMGRVFQIKATRWSPPFAIGL